LQPELHAQVLRSHLGEVLGAENILPTELHHLGSVRRAIDKARRGILERGDLADPPLVRRVANEAGDGSAYSI